MSGTTLTIGGVALSRRESGTVGQARAVARLRRDFGTDILTDAGAIQTLIETTGGVHALLACFCDGPVQEVDEEALSMGELTAVLTGFFGDSGQPSTVLPAGFPPDGPSQSESPATS